MPVIHRKPGDRSVPLGRNPDHRAVPRDKHPPLPRVRGQADSVALAMPSRVQYVSWLPRYVTRSEASRPRRFPETTVMAILQSLGRHPSSTSVHPALALIGKPSIYLPGYPHTATTPPAPQTPRMPYRDFVIGGSPTPSALQVPLWYRYRYRYQQNF